MTGGIELEDIKSNKQLFKTYNFSSTNSVVSPKMKIHHENIANVRKEHVVIVKGDSVASDYYWREQDAHVLPDIQESVGPSVLIPNGTTIA